MLFPTILCILMGTLVAMPQEEYKSNIEFFNTNVGDIKYRLLDTVYPHRMNVDLDVYLNESRFNGLVTMDVEVKDPDLMQIVFHQKVDSIQGITIVAANDRVVNLHPFNTFSTDDYYELLEINLVSPIGVGNYTISVRYTGIINENPFDGGLYKGYYFYKDEEIAYATTQFAPFFARRVFPCFDEPMFKSRFVIAITRDSSLSPSYSNMAIARTDKIGTDRIREEFHPSPVMSAYLAAIHVSDFEESESTGTPTRPFKIISRRGVIDQHKWAADIGVRLTNVLDDYFGIRYHEMGQDVLMKNDHIAVPDFTLGALENWGLVSYREAFLLYDRNNTNLSSKILIAIITSHELAHKWFGNLVTNLWWSNIWLNEAFVTYFGCIAAHWVEPDFELDNQFVVDYLHRALASDASPGTNAMNWPDVASIPSIVAHFSTTSYDKGASVLRMIEHFVGFRNFRLALRYYLSHNSYGNTIPEDVYDAFERAVSEDHEFMNRYPDVNIGILFRSWVENPGSPVVKVEVNTVTGDITVSQERYLISGTRPDITWHIPLTWTHGGDINFNDTRPTTILSNSSTIIRTDARDDWVIFNIAQSGLYRVNYDDDNWQRIGAYLKGANRQRIDKMNRAQIANDLLYFIRSGDVNKTIAFNVLEFLKDETDYFVWKAAINQLEFIHRRFEHLPLASSEFSAYLLDLLETVVQHIGYEDRDTDSTSVILNRMQIMSYACNLGHAGCVKESLEKWRAHRANDNNLIPPNYRPYVYCVGLREGDVSDYQFLFRKYETSENAADMSVILRALACTKDDASFRHYLQQSIVNRKIRAHDRTNVINFALQENREKQDIVLNFIYTNYDDIRNTYGSPSWSPGLSAVFLSISGFMTNFQIIQQFQLWLYENQNDFPESFNIGVASINIALNNLIWGNDNAPEIYDFLLARSSSTVFVSSILLLLVAIIVQILN